MSDLLFFSGPLEGGNNANASGGAGPGTRDDSQTPDIPNGEELVKELEAIVERLKVIYSQKGTPITDNTIEVSRFCRCLEVVLRHGMKDKVTFWGERKDYFNYLTENNSGLKTFDQLVKKVHSLADVITGQGKGRALIRLCLNEQLLADCIQNSIGNSKKTKDWYQPYGVLIGSPLTQRLISALYDLSDVTFDLPVDGIDLDESWPSFMQKSFTKATPGSENSTPSKTSVPGFIKKTLKARSVEPKQKQEIFLERAVEEQPSEIFVKQEIPFDLTLVGSLMSEIRLLMIDEFEGYTSSSSLPSIKVDKMDDITSGLSLLKDYLSTMSSDVNSNLEKRQRLIHQLKSEMSQLQVELKEASEKYNELEEEIDMKEKDLIKSTQQVKLVNEERNALLMQQKNSHQEISNLQELVAKLEYEKSNLEENLQDESEMVRLQSDLSDVHQALHVNASYHSLLLNQLTQECQAKAAMNSSLSFLQEAKSKAESDKVNEIADLNRAIDNLRKELEELKIESNFKESQLKEQQSLHNEEMTKLTEELSLTVNHQDQIMKERDLIKEEVKSMNGLVEQETASLRFELSIANMQLQQVNESHLTKDSQLVELKELLNQSNEQLNQTRKIIYQKEEFNQELQQQLTISVSRSTELSEEIKSLNEQLTEKTLNRDQVREESLRLQRECDDQKERTTKEMQRLNSQVTKLSEENEHLRKVLQKLLEQKVNLWKHADKLEEEQVAKGVWIDSREITQCMGCDVVFTMFIRKHHCRSCGKVFCANCCCHKVQLPSNKDPVRVCKSCQDKIVSLRTPQANCLVNTLSDEDQPHSTTTPINSSMEVKVPNVNSFPGGVPMSSSLFLGGSDEPILKHVQNLTPFANKTSQNSSQQNSLDNSAEYHIQRLNSKSPSIPPLPSLNYTISSDTTAADPDDDFCIIDALIGSDVFPGGMDSSGTAHLNVVALQAKLATLESAAAHNDHDIVEKDGRKHQLHPPDDDVIEVEDVEVEGGEVLPIQVPVALPRTVVSWQFSSQPKGIAIGLKYSHREDDESLTEVLPLKRVMSHKTMLTGEYIAQKAGIYTLVFSNAHSKYSSRTLSYKIWKKLP